MKLFGIVTKFRLQNIFLTILFLNLGMFQFLSTYEFTLKLGYTYIDDMLKFSRKSKTGHVVLGLWMLQIQVLRNVKKNDGS